MPLSVRILNNAAKFAIQVIRLLNAETRCCCFKGIILAHYDAAFRRHHQLCLSILKHFGFGQRVMETRILMEVEEMINKVREEQGRAFDLRQLTTSCVANVIMNMLFGRRFDHSDPAYQQLMSNFDRLTANFSIALELFPFLRFIPYFRKRLDEDLRTAKDVYSFINDNIARCTEVCIFSVLYYKITSTLYDIRLWY